MARTGTAALLVAVVVTFAACGDDDAGSAVTVPERSTTSSSTTEPTTTTEDPVAAVEQAFYDQWDAFVEILSDPDPDNPLIDRHFTGEAKRALLDSIGKFVAEMKAARTPDDPDNFQPRIVDAVVESATSAVVYECTIDGTIIVHSQSGEVLDDDVETYEARNQFTLEDGQWKLESSGDMGEGDPSCDER